MACLSIRCRVLFTSFERDFRFLDLFIRRSFPVETAKESALDTLERDRANLLGGRSCWVTKERVGDGRVVCDEVTEGVATMVIVDMPGLNEVRVGDEVSILARDGFSTL